MGREKYESEPKRRSRARGECRRRSLAHGQCGRRSRARPAGERQSRNARLGRDTVPSAVRRVQEAVPGARQRRCAVPGAASLEVRGGSSLTSRLKGPDPWQTLTSVQLTRGSVSDGPVDQNTDPCQTAFEMKWFFKAFNYPVDQLRLYSDVVSRSTSILFRFRECVIKLTSLRSNIHEPCASLFFDMFCLHSRDYYHPK